MLPGVERAVLWDYKQDSIQVRNYIRTLQDMQKEIVYCKTRYPELYRQLKYAKHVFIADYERKIDRIWNDQKCGTYFRSGKPFEPHQVVKHKNLIMWDGLTRFTELIALETGITFLFMAMGSGTSPPAFSDIALESEVSRVDMTVAGDLNADGIILKNSAVFPTNIPDVTISEFGALDDTDEDSPGVLEYRVVIEEPTERLGHLQGLTQIQASHSIAFIALENIT